MIVVAAVIRDRPGKILLTRRPAGSHMGGLWEFPGGKVEAGEAPIAALGRELEEELAISAKIGSPLTFAVHEEPGMRIVLLFFAATLGDTSPTALEGQEIAWVAPGDLPSYPTPPADAELVRILARRSTT
jgi:8-oxo-dGTP diphosphatase